MKKKSTGLKNFMGTPKNPVPFIPDIWSQKLVGKFYDKTVLSDKHWSMFEPVPHFMKTLTAEIKRLTEEGLTPEQIAEKIDLNPWKGTEIKFGSVEKFKLYESQAGLAASSFAVQIDAEIMKSINEADLEMAVTKAEVELAASKTLAEVRKMQAEIEAQLVAGVMSSIGPQVEVSLPQRSLFMKGLTGEIKKMSEAGLTSEEIAEKIDPEMFEPVELKGDLAVHIRSLWKKAKQDQIKMQNTYGLKVIKPGGLGILGTTS